MLSLTKFSVSRGTIMVCCLAFVPASSLSEEGAQSADEPLPIVRLEVAPDIDGDLGDKAWNGAPWFGGMRTRSGTDIFTAHQALFSFGWTDTELYVRGVCLKDPEAFRAIAQETDDGSTGGGDSFSILMVVEDSEVELYQISISSSGGVSDTRRFPRDTRKTSERKDEWSSGIRAATALLEDGWAFEAAIPLKPLELRPEVGRRVRMNVGRSISSAGPHDWGYSFSSWCKVNWLSAELESFYPLALSPASKGEAWAGALEQNIHRLFLSEANARESLALSSLAETEKLCTLPGLSRQTLNRAEELKTAVEAASLPEESGVLEIARARNTYIQQRKQLLDLQNILQTHRLQVVLKEGLAGIPEGVNQVDDVWFLRSDKMVAAVDANTGGLLGIWDRDSEAQILTSNPFEYRLQTREREHGASDSADRVVETEPGSDSLTLACRSALVEGLLIEKTYSLKGDKMLALRLSYSGVNDPDHLIHISCRTHLGELLAKKAVFQVPLSATPPENVLVDAGNIEEQDLTLWHDDLKILAFRRDADLGIAQYLYRMRERPVVAVGIRAGTLYSDGWRMHPTSFFLKQTPFSLEFRYHLFSGNRMQFHREYLALPEIKQIWDGIHPDPRIRFVRFYGPGPGDHSWPGDEMKRPNRFFRNNLRSYEYAYALVFNHQFCAHFPVGDDVQIPVDYWRERFESGRERRMRYERFKLYMPNFLFCAYHNPHEIFPGTPEFEQQKEFLIQKRDGSYMRGAYGATRYGIRVLFSEAFQEWAVRKLVEEVEYYGPTGLYFDGPWPRPYLDWGTNQVDGQDIVMFGFSRRLFEAMHELGGIYFHNGVIEDFYSDISLFEGGSRSSPWRQAMEALYLKKLYQVPGQMPVLWDNKRVPAKQRRTINDALALGLSFRTDTEEKYFPHPEGEHDYERRARPFFPYYTLAYELRDTTLADLDYSPCWFKEDTANQCVNVLKKPAGTLLVTTLQHEEQSAPIEASIKASEMNLGNGPWFVVKHLGRPIFTSTNSAEAAYTELAPNWRSAFNAVVVERASAEGDGRLALRLEDIAPDVLNIAVITDVPALVYSIEGEPTQLMIPEQPGAMVSGSVNTKERRVELDVDALAHAEILVWYPEDWGLPAYDLEHRETLVTGDVVITRDGGTLVGRPVSVLGQERFFHLPVHAGKTHVTLSAAKAGIYSAVD